MKKTVRTFFLSCVMILSVSPVLGNEDKPIGFSKSTLTIDGKKIQVEVAQTEQERQRGLMHRKSLGKNNGMLFVFGAPAQSCMWMKNTFIPLSVAFIDHAGRIVNMEDMQPQTTVSHCSKGLVWYALEMNKGWFSKNRIQPGTLIRGLP